MTHRPEDDADDRRPSAERRLTRVLERPDLVRVVPRMPPEALQQLIRRAGLERSVDLVEAATREQLAAVLDLDLWAAPQPGGDAELDADRLGEWVEELVERDAALAARVVARIDRSLVATGLSRYVRVFDPGVLEPTESTDDEPRESGLFAGEGLTAEVGGYLVQACRPDAWDAIVGLLVELSTEQAECFHAVMQGCRRLSDAGREVDGLDDLLEAREQLLHDVALSRDDRRGERGYGTPADARAFLALARQPHSIDPRALRRSDPREPGTPLLVGEHSGRGDAGGLQPLMEYLRERHPDLCLTRGEELAFLANTLVAGCRLPSRPLTPREAAEAAVATCGLGLPRQPAPPAADFLVGHDLIGTFEDGWAALHREVSLFVAEGLLEVLRGVRIGRTDTLDDLHALRRSLETRLSAGTPWLVQEALDVLATLDTPAWCGLLGLLNELPVIPAVVPAILERRAGRIDPHAFAFIATAADIETVRAFMARLPQLLAGGAAPPRARQAPIRPAQRSRSATTGSSRAARRAGR